MIEERFALEVDGVEIPTALTLPEPARANGWALLLIPGSLNSDVDGNYAPMFPGQPPARTHVYKDLAGQLAAEGVAVLRFSKRGPGTGCVTRDEALARERYREFPQRVRVAEAFLDELRRRRPEAPLAVAGHSEGAVVATLLAQRRSEAARLILLSGPAKPLLQLMIWQRHEASRRGGEAVSAEDFEQAMGWATDYAAGRELPAERSGNAYAQLIDFFLRPDARPYLQSVEQVDPAQALARVRLPVLLVQGGRDTSVNEPNADLLLKAQPRAEIVRFAELSHCYKRAPEGLDSQASFLLEGDSDPAVAAAVAHWLNSTCASVNS
ncbi:MAG: alpha/beta hydrolase [Terriglobales bacterium]